jgi:hypothetical protein
MPSCELPAMRTIASGILEMFGLPWGGGATVAVLMNDPKSTRSTGFDPSRHHGLRPVGFTGGG